jgi:hypothetical protein
LNLTTLKYPKQEPQKVGKGPYQQHTPDRACCLLELVEVAAVGDDLCLPWGAGVKAPILVVHRPCALLHDRQRAWRHLQTRGAEVTTLTSGGGRRTDVAIVLAPTAALVTSAAEAAGDSTTGVPGNLLPNAS